MIKNVDDYVDIIHARWSTMSKDQIKKILVHGFGWMFQKSIDNFPINIKTPNGTVHLNFNMNKSEWYKNNLKKLGIEKWRRSMTKTEFDNFYYVVLSDEQFKKIKKKIFEGKMITLSNVRLHKSKDFCFKLHGQHFLKIFYPIDMGDTFVKEKLKTYRYEYYAKRDDKERVILL